MIVSVSEDSGMVMIGVRFVLDGGCRVWLCYWMEVRSRRGGIFFLIFIVLLFIVGRYGVWILESLGKWSCFFFFLVVV